MPDLVVLVEPDAADALGALDLLDAAVPHLSVVIREATIVVGPLVIPGRACCLRCLDLHRGDRDPVWPRLLAQLLSRRRTGDSETVEETASAQLAACLAALQVLGHLDGFHRPASLGATLEVELPDGLVSRRPWPAHPRCDCGAGSTEPDTSPARATSTMNP
jgi:bacteriocin biosynthesis cyclodehydratase domain-containing protein